MLCGDGVKSVSVSGLATALLFAMVAGSPAQAAEPVLTARVLVEVCLPYAQRAQGFEKAIGAARDLDFRRPVADRAPLDEWASEVELVSRDGVWRIRLEEGPVEVGDGEAYAVSCSLSSTRASRQELARLGRRAFGDERRWTTEAEDPPTWSRRTRFEDVRLEALVRQGAADRPELVVRGLYF